MAPLFVMTNWKLAVDFLPWISFTLAIYPDNKSQLLLGMSLSITWIFSTKSPHSSDMEF